MARRPRNRVSSVIAALAVFVLGTNYCVVAALAASRGSGGLACHSAIPHATTHACCGGKASEPSSGHEPASLAKPCCMLASPVNPPELARTDVVASAWTAAILSAIIAPRATESPRFATITTGSVSGPGTRDASRPPSPRAPPLA